MKILNSNNKSFDKVLDNILIKRKYKIKSSLISVTGIINDVKKNGDKALLKYEKKFNLNKTIIPSAKQISRSIKSLDKKVKKQLILHIQEFINFILFKNSKTFLTLINLRINLNINIYQSSLPQFMFQGHLLRIPLVF